MILDIENKQTLVIFDEKIEDLMRNCVEKTLEKEDLGLPIEISITLVDNIGIRILNSKYRNIDTPTDVLSFPLYESTDEIKLLPGEEAVAIGDIVISLEKTLEQSKEYENDFATELGFLTVHGVLHLLGYDHESEEDEILMRTQESNIMKLIGLSREERFHE